MKEAPALLEAQGVTKAYDAPAGPLEVLKGVDVSLETGDTLAVVGPSGCGKSTLLNILGALDRPSSGVVTCEGQDLHDLSSAELARFRNRHVGFVFQFHHLLPQCSVVENILVPTLVNKGANAPRDRARKLLERVGLSSRADYRPGLLSGGERQRAAVVRALINAPRLLLADEPTGSLNEASAGQLVRLLLELNHEEEIALLVVTHSMDVAKQMGRILELRNGVLTPMEARA